MKRSKMRPVKSEKRTERDEIRLYVSPVMLVMAVYFVAMGMAFEFVCSISAVLLHECAHAKTASKLGYELNVIKLMPYGASLSGVSDIKPKHEVLIAVSGPLFNLILATAFAALWWLVPESFAFTETFSRCNLYIGVFNLLPVYPLDGGRVLNAVLVAKLGNKRAIVIMRIISAVFGIVALAAFVLSAVYSPNICLLSVGLFMLVSAFIPDNRTKYSALFTLDKKKQRIRSPLEIKSFAVDESCKIAELITVLDTHRYSEFTVLCNDAETVMGRLNETQLTDIIKKYGYDITVGEGIRMNNE